MANQISLSPEQIKRLNEITPMIETKAKPEVSRAANSNGNGAIKCAVTVVLACIAAVALSSSASAANDVPIGLRTIWKFDQQGIVRFCYDKTPAVIYSKYDVARKMTSILRRELDGEEQVVGEFPGAPDPRSLSCSQDGQTIVALGGDHRESLFIAKGTQKSVYLNSSLLGFFECGSVFADISRRKQHNSSRNANLGRWARFSERNENLSKRGREYLLHE